MKRHFFLKLILLSSFCFLGSPIPLFSATLHPMVIHPEHHDTSSPLPADQTPSGSSPSEGEVPCFSLIQEEDLSPIQKTSRAGGEDPLLQDRHSPLSMPEPGVSFEGLFNVNSVKPPDPQGDVGPDHYVQVVNLSFAVWDKQGALLYGPADLNSLWKDFGGPCEFLNNGDPIVLYDHLADRWLLSRFALPNGKNSGPYYQCIAISKTPDPTDQWHRYAYKTSDTKFNDYPKFGVWPDGYYMSVNQFETGSFTGAGVAAFEREKMIRGLDARMMYFDLEDRDMGLRGMLPSDLDGPPPPTGTPNYFLQMDDDAWSYPQDQLELWTFHADWSSPENARFRKIAQLATGSFDTNLCDYDRDCIPQPDTNAGLDAIADRVMFRLQFRDFGSHRSMVANHTVDVDGGDHAGIRWYELRDAGQGWFIRNQGTYGPDDHHRWMGSVAMDRNGNMAMGYSLSSPSIYPSLAYTGRLADDPPDTMAQGEAVLVSGTGSQLGSSFRWGDYSMMSVDPVDGCTFWYTGEYYRQNSRWEWQTQIGAFRFPSCSDGSQGALSGLVADGDGNPINGARIITGTAATLSHGSGRYRFAQLPAGETTVTASAYGYGSQSTPVTIEEGVAHQQDFTLSPLPSAFVEGRVTDDRTGWPLYAEITLSAPGYTQRRFTDPVTGRYRIELFAGVAYDVEVHSLVPGYGPRSVQFSLGDPADIALSRDEGCSAPGYAPFLETFDICGPTGRWSRIDNAGSGTVWQFSAAGEEGNRTGGTGCYAASGVGTSHLAEMDTTLISPPIDCSFLTKAFLSFQFDYRTRTGEDAAEVAVSPDGGTTWIRVWESPDGSVQGPEAITLDISDEAAGHSRVRVRFRHRDAFRQGVWGIDDVAISGGPGSCVAPASGGLVVGNVYDRDAGVPVNGATVASDGGASVVTTATPDDPDVDDGFFALYVPSGSHRLQATYPAFLPDGRTLIPVDGDSVGLDFHLGSADLTLDPTVLEVEASPGGDAAAAITLTNTGSVYAEYALTVASPNGEVPPWIVLSPAEGLVPSGTSVEIEARFETPYGETGDRFEAVITLHHSGSSSPFSTPVALLIADRPLPVDDAAVTARNGAVLIDVLANDHLVGPDPPEIELASVPGHGTARIEETAIRYTPDPGYTGEDRFVYALDGRPAAVTVHVWERIAEQPISAPGGIPDEDPAGLTSAIHVTEHTASAVERVTVTLTLEHPYLSDLSAWVTAPNGERVLLFDNLTGADLNDTTWDDLSPFDVSDGAAPYRGSFRPTQALALFSGQSVSGEWTLEIMDHSPLDEGKLIDWEIDIFYSDMSIIQVDDPADTLLADGRCTLREAVEAANTDTPVGGCSAGGKRDTIRLPAGRYRLTREGPDENNNQTGDLDIVGSGSVILQGPSDGEAILETDLEDRLIHTHAGSDVTLSHLTIRGGAPKNQSVGGGGGIFNQAGRVTVRHCIISDNRAPLGGGIYNGQGTVRITSSQLRNNTAQSGGGLITLFGHAAVDRCTIRRNEASSKGGGIAVFNSDLSITSTTVRENTATTGGGITNQTGTVVINRSTISKNQAFDGGGFRNTSGTARLRFVSVADNEATGNGGGLSIQDGSLELANTLVARNRVEVKFETADISGPIVSGGGNLIGSSSGGWGYRYRTDLLNIDPLLTPLADHGGTTLTHAIPPRSPAVDAIDCRRFEPDQRGIYRPVNDRCDIGAFEQDGRSYPPTAEDDRAVSTGNPVLVDVLANDGDANGDPLAVSIEAPPASGTLRFTGEDLVYTPESGFLGEDAFRYTVSDGENTDTATVTILVGPNTPPSLRDDGTQVHQNEWIIIDVLKNDSDRDGDALTLRSASPPEHGGALVAGDRIYYFPEPGFLGRDEFTYRADDGIDTGEASVTVTVWKTDRVIEVDDMADGMEPNGRCSLREAITAAVSGEPVDSCAAGGLHRIVQLPAGVFTITDLPSADEWLTGDLDIPEGRMVLQGRPDGGTILQGAPGHRVLHVHEGAEVEIRDLTIRGSDDGGEEGINGGILNDGFLRVAAVALIRNRGETGGGLHNTGDLVLENATLSGNGARQGGGLYNEGHAVIHFTTFSDNRAAFDGGGIHTLSGWTELKNTLIAGNAAGRDGPDLWGSGQSRGGNLLGTTGGTPLDPFAETDLLNVDPQLIPLADNGGAAKTHALRIDSPAVDAVDCLGVGGERFYTDGRAVDRPQGEGCDIGAFEHDDAYYPPAAEGDSAIVANDRSVIVPVLANDGSAGALPLFVAGLSPPQHGVAVDNLDGTVTYTPEPGYVGSDGFGYTVSDGTAVDTATVSVWVVVNEPPIAGDDAAETFQGEPVTIPVLANDRDPDGYVLFVSAVGPPDHGTAVTDGAVITYTPDPGVSGTDTFPYHVSDGTRIAKARVSVTITGVGLGDVLTVLKVLAGIPVPADHLDPLLRLTERVDMAAALRILRGLVR